MKPTNYQQIEHSDDNGYGQFYMLDDIEYNNVWQTRKHKLSDPCIDLSHNNLPSPPIIVRVTWCVGISCIGIASCCVIFIYSIPYW